MDPFSRGKFSSFKGFLFRGSEGFRASSFSFNGFDSFSSIGFIGFSGGFSGKGGIRVKSIHQFVVGEGVFLLEFVLTVGRFNGSDNGLDFIGVNESGEIGVSHGGS